MMMPRPNTEQIDILFQEAFIEHSIRTALHDDAALTRLETLLATNDITPYISDDTISVCVNEYKKEKADLSLIQRLCSLPKLGPRFSLAFLNKAIDDLLPQYAPYFKVGEGRDPKDAKTVNTESVNKAINLFLLQGMFSEALSLLTVPGNSQIQPQPELLNMGVKYALQTDTTEFLSTLNQIPDIWNKVNVDTEEAGRCASRLLKKRKFEKLEILMSLGITLNPNEVAKMASTLLRKGDIYNFITLIEIPFISFTHDDISTEDMNRCAKQLAHKKDITGMRMLIGIPWIAPQIEERYTRIIPNDVLWNDMMHRIDKARRTHND